MTRKQLFFGIMSIFVVAVVSSCLGLFLGPSVRERVTQEARAWATAIAKMMQPATPETSLPPQPLQQARKAAVGVRVAAEMAWQMGSGVIINPGGLILTSYHILETDGKLPEPGEIQIALGGQGELPEWDYRATIAAIDRKYDLALVWLDADVARNMNLSAIPMGEPNDLEMGDTVYALGYPNIGGPTLTLTKGVVSGRWEGFIKADLKGGEGGSGSMVLNEQGELIGIVVGGPKDSPGYGLITYILPVGLAGPLINRALSQAEATPTPTHTPKPTYTPTPIPPSPTTTPLPPTATPTQSMRAVFTDDFEGQRFLFSGDSQDGGCTFRYENGQYHIEVKTQYSVCLDLYPHKYSNFILDVDLVLISGEGFRSPEGGVIFGYQDDVSFYKFGVARFDKEYHILKQVRGVWVEEWGKWGESSHINGPDFRGISTNHLTLIVRDSEIEMYCNGHLIDKVSDPAYKEGWVGLSVGTWGGNGHGAFDNFEIRPLG